MRATQSGPSSQAARTFFSVIDMPLSVTMVPTSSIASTSMNMPRGGFWSEVRSSPMSFMYLSSDALYSCANSCSFWLHNCEPTVRRELAGS